jgi:demethylmenaquinone methyltransferase / 2-methoxy-6-polyprenyl-1,4-benzoquinol methylase
MPGDAPDPRSPADPGLPGDRNRFARLLFSGLPSGYDRLAEALSFGQNGRWRRFMVSRVSVPSEGRVLDVATGTAGVAVALARSTGARVVGLDQSEEMLATGARRVEEAGLSGRVPLVIGRGERLPFRDGTFDAVTFTYLLRYVEDPAATLRELTRVLRAGGTMANLEFHVPANPVWRAPLSLYTRVGLPSLGRAVSPAWHEVGKFLGPSIREFYRTYPLVDQLAMWRTAGIGDVRARPMSLGGGVVIWGRKSR